MVVLADEPVGLQPAGERGLGDRNWIGGGRSTVVVGQAARRDERTLGDLRPMRMQVHPHPHLELVDPQPLRLRPPLAHRLDDVIGGRLDEAPLRRRTR